MNQDQLKELECWEDALAGAFITPLHPPARLVEIKMLDCPDVPLFIGKVQGGPEDWDTRNITWPYERTKP